MSLIRALLLALCLTTSASADLPTCFDAVCRVSNGPAVGSGCCYDYDGSTYYVLTNWHVAGGVGQRVQVEFYRRGYQSPKIAGQVVRSQHVEQQHIDVAVIAIRGAALPNGIAPAVVPLADRSRDVQPGELVYTIGASGGSWPTAFKGHIVRGRSAQAFTVRPAAADGRSGSPIFNADADEIIGLIAWRDDSNGVTIAKKVATVHGAIGS